MSNLRPFQQRTRDKLLNGRSFVLQASTGAGKTRAALEPFFAAWEQNHPEFPRKCFYVVPRRVLASQFYAEYKTLAKDRCPTMSVSIQTGEQSDDQKLEGDLIFCTIDQFLASYLTMPYGLPRRLANVNAGALVGAYIVMDEFHLHDPEPTLPTALYALGQLRKVAPVLLMTATFSETMLKQLAAWLDADYECLHSEEIRQIDTDEGRRASRQRVWHAQDQPMSTEAILAQHKHRSIALCNQVVRAQMLYQDLIEYTQTHAPETKVILLHSRFLKEDRRRNEGDAISLFGKDADRTQGSVILVATQAIEVGVDITCEVLHTEVAPASSLIQRAGRCARYPQEQGRVEVYPVEDKPNALLPYTKQQAEEAQQSLIWIQQHSDQVYDFGTEQQLIDAVTTPRDKTIIEGLKATRYQHTDMIHRVLTGKFEGEASQALIRDAESRRLLIHASPDHLLKHPVQEPYQAEGFGISPQTLFVPFKRWQEHAMTLGRKIEDLVWALDADDTRDLESNRTDYFWTGVSDKSQFMSAAVICVSPLLATYTPKEGLLLGKGGAWQSGYVMQVAESKKFDYGRGYRLETYEEHIRLVMEVMREEIDKVLPAMTALERAAQWPPGSLRHAAHLAAVLHDVGKLSVRWQGWVAAYQKEIGLPVPIGYCGAHTDSVRGNSAHEAAGAKTAKLKQPHAAESAVATYKILHTALGGNNQLRRAVQTAIARHHSPFAGNFTEYRLISGAVRQIELGAKYADFIDGKLLAVNPYLLTSAQPNLIKADGFWAQPMDLFEWLAYLQLVRLLRAADSLGTGRGALH